MSTTMNERTTGRIAESIYYPCVVMVLPLDSKMPDGHLKHLTGRIEEEITGKYKRDKATHVIQKLHHALEQIDYSANKKSAAVFVSPMYETVLHLDVPLEETIMVDEPYEIRDLVNNMQPADKYILLLQSAQSFKVFLGNHDKLIKLKTTLPDNIAAYRNDIAEKVENFSDVTDRKEVMMDKFIHHIDKELDAVLNQYRLPVFVIGTERMNGHFKKITHHEKNIISYIHGNLDGASLYELGEALKPHLDALKQNARKELDTKIEQALNANKLVFGIDEVWRNAMDKKGRTLIVEKNYFYPHVVDHDGNLKSDTSVPNPSLMRDAVDIIIEKVLESGGEVKFTEEDSLKDFNHIALIQYY